MIQQIIRSHALRLGLANAGLFSFLGCSGGPGAIPKTSVDASSASAAAIELYDADGDGFLAGAELDKAPGIKAGLKKADADGDGKISQQELATRMESWNASPYAILSVSCGVNLDGVPLDGAVVTFDPEPYLKEVIKQGVGATSGGSAGVSIPKDQRLVADSPPGLQLGYYTVRISKQENGKELIPAKYNAESTLGQEVAYDDAGIQNQIVFNLTTK